MRFDVTSPRIRAAALALALFGAQARADTLLLHNGDRLTGRVLHMSPSTLTFETTWAGEMRIPRYEIRAIETDKPVTVLRERTGRTESATLKPADDGRLLLVSERRADDPAAGGADGAMPPAAVRIAITRLRYINPKPEESGEGASYAGRVTLSGSSAHGSDTGERVYAEGDFSARAHDWRYAVNGKLLRARDAASDTASNWLLSANHDRFLDDEGFVYLRGSAERDRFRDIAGRLTIGAGYGRQLIDTGRTTLSLRGGVEGISVRRIAGPDESAPALGWGMNFTHRLDLLSAEIFHDQQGFRTLGSEGHLTLRSRSGLRLPLASGLTASLQLNFAWESDPAPGRAGADTTWLFGLGYAW